jgi:hypothetical protein
MKRVLKILGITIGLLIIIVVGIVVITNKPLPQGEIGPQADALAKKMLSALNQKAYRNTRFLEWSYQGGKNQYQWDKQRGICVVKWTDIEVDLNLNDPGKSTVIKAGALINGDEKSTLVGKALNYFNNDSFWLVAPYKVFDNGTTRSLVALKDGSNGLLVTYTSGGTTPGDSYLWKLNPDGFPTSYQMWVQILPIGGLEASWDDWIVAESGAFLPKSHQLGPITLSMGNVKGYN